MLRKPTGWKPVLLAGKMPALPVAVASFATTLVFLRFFFFAPFVPLCGYSKRILIAHDPDCVSNVTLFRLFCFKSSINEMIF